jgi:hypothetical protein
MNATARLACACFAVAMTVLVACGQDASFSESSGRRRAGDDPTARNGDATALPGVTAQGTDAGAADAGAADAGVDAGVADAGGADVSGPDSDLDQGNGGGDAVDGGATDDGAADGGAADAGAGDGGAADGGLADGAGDAGGDGGTPPPPPRTPEEVAAKCGSSPMQTKVQSIAFADPGMSCVWSQGGNGAKKDGEIRGRIEQSVALALPEGAVICDLGFTFAETQMRYDDEIFLTFNDLVLAGSMDYTARFDQSGDFFKYDWTKLINAPYSHDLYADYCLGAQDGTGHCMIPPTETTGTMQLEFASSLVHKLSVKAIQSKRFDLGWVTVGDNDDRVDCRHSDFGFDVTIKYVK